MRSKKASPIPTKSDAPPVPDNSTAAARHLSRRAICIHDEEEREPEAIRRKPIVSVNGQDVEDVEDVEDVKEAA